MKSLRKDIERDGLRAVAHDLLLAAGAASHCKLLVVIDQFEELLTQTEPAERSKFVAALAPALGGPIQVLATMRSEYVDALGKDPDLMNLGTRIHQVRPLESDALREVIEEPAKVAGLSFEDDLVTRLIADTGTGDALPLLAFTLEQLADGASRGDRLTHRRYDEIGGVQGALQRQADEALEAACDATGKTPDQVIDELLNLVTIDEQGRPSKRRLILDGSSDHEESLKPFLERRLLSTEVADKTTSITVSHDAFLVNWPPLNKEIDAKVIALRTRRVVETEARDWEANERDAAMLLQGPKLAKAIVDTGAEFEPVTGSEQSPLGKWWHLRFATRWRRPRKLITGVDLDDTARDFLQASAEADRAKRRPVPRRRRSAVFAVLVITLRRASFGVVPRRTKSQHGPSEEEANKNAIAQRLIAEAREDLSQSGRHGSLATSCWPAAACRDEGIRQHAISHRGRLCQHIQDHAESPRPPPRGRPTPTSPKCGRRSRRRTDRRRKQRPKAAVVGPADPGSWFAKSKCRGHPRPNTRPPIGGDRRLQPGVARGSRSVASDGTSRSIDAKTANGSEL